MGIHGHSCLLVLLAVENVDCILSLMLLSVLASLFVIVIYEVSGLEAVVL